MFQRLNYLGNVLDHSYTRFSRLIGQLQGAHIVRAKALDSLLP